MGGREEDIDRQRPSSASSTVASFGISDNYNHVMPAAAPPFFSDSPDARSKSITTADLETHGVCN